MTEIYWRGHRVGSVYGSPYSVLLLNGEGRSIRADITRISLSEDMTLQDVARLDIVFDPDFAELRGITNVQLETPNRELVRANEDSSD